MGCRITARLGHYLPDPMDLDPMTKRDLRFETTSGAEADIDVAPLSILIRDWRRRADAAHEEGDARGVVYDTCAAQLDEALTAAFGRRYEKRDRETLSLL